MSNINPLGSVPALQLNDAIVYDSKICNEYLDDVYPGDKLVPSDPYLRARDRMLMEHYTKVIYEPLYVQGKQLFIITFASHLIRGQLLKKKLVP